MTDRVAGGAGAAERLRSALLEIPATEPEIPVLWPVDLFIGLGGEELRPNLFVTQDAEGRSLCLRPEFTIPVCKSHIENGGGPATYRYFGPIFRRLRETGPGEFFQAGIEKLGGGSDDPLKDDAQMVEMALTLLRSVTGDALSVTVGDTAILQATLRGLGLSGSVAARLRRAYATPAAFNRVFEHYADSLAGNSTGKAGAGSSDIPELVRSILESTAVPLTPARSAEAIAKRFAARSQDRGSLGSRERAALEALRTLDCPLPEASGALEALASEYDFSFGDVLETFTRRAGRLTGALEGTAEVRFSGGFGQRFDYYTGFIFEVHGGAERHIASGGRYDRLLGLLGGRNESAIGFSVWPERLPEEPGDGGAGQ